MTPLRQRMLDAMIQRGFAQRTQLQKTRKQAKTNPVQDQKTSRRSGLIRPRITGPMHPQIHTQSSYIDAIHRLAKHYRRDPALYTPAEIQAYLLHMVKDEHLSYSTMNQAACASRFLFEEVLGHARERFRIPMAKVPNQQPELLAREEIAHLFASCTHPVHGMLLQTVYATGLRVSEACSLRLSDIDSHSDRMCIRVASGTKSRRL